MTTLSFPAGKRFAFPILDDTDETTVENVAPVYELLHRCRLRTTKTVWVYDCPEESRNCFSGDTLERKAYLDFIHTLARNGFEIAFHGATMESSPRTRTIGALAFLQQEFGCRPLLHCNHGLNRDNMYWGAKRFHTGILRWVSSLKEHNGPYAGDDIHSEYFWGDACKAQVRYIRSFTFRDLNLLKVCPRMPYALASTPYVNYWFCTTEAADVTTFARRLTRKRIDQLEHEGGVCIVSTHFGKGFAPNGRIDGRITAIVEYLSAKNGWFVPVSDLLDHLLEQQQTRTALSRWELMRLETRFVYDQTLRTLLY